MTATAIAADLNESLYIQGLLTTKVTFYDNILVNDITQFYNLVLSQITGTGIRVDTGLLQQFLGSSQTNTIDIC